MFRKVLVANRGEIALRIIHACHAVGAKAVAVYSDADRDSPHLKYADETVCIGPGPAAESYLNQDAILEAAFQTGCQAVHPGFGFLAENARFVTRCRHHKLTFIGPNAKSIREMGDKVTARETMLQAGVPVMPGSDALVRTPEQARTIASEVGYPVLLKATAGGGGKGMRRVDCEEDLEAAFLDAARESEAAFSNPDLYLEKFIVGGRHIEFQVLADRYGNVVHLGERECSIQRRNQKLLEESPASRFDPALRTSLGEIIRNALVKIGYINAGTIEFLMDANGDIYFMEMNTRIQVEHPVTELVTGVDLVAWQLRIAAGEKLTLKQEDITWTGHAIECRINAEDPAHDFRPSPGTLTVFEPPTNDIRGPVRLETHVEEGYKIPTYYDSMICKLIVHGRDRADAIAKMREALTSFRIEGVPTTKGLQLDIINDMTFQSGHYNCQFLVGRSFPDSLPIA